MTLAMFFKWASVASIVFLLIGLYKPWWVLWWEDTQNRLKVIRLYLSISLISLAISKLIEYFA